MEAAAVHLIRQLKMPTAERLALGVDDVDEHLPAAMRSVEAALEAGDLQAADERLDAAIGQVIAGPGHERRRRDWSFPVVVLWAWLGVLLLLFLLTWLTTPG